MTVILHTLYALKQEGGDVFIYNRDWKNKGALVFTARFPRETCKTPDRRNRYVTLNCWKYKLKWLTTSDKF